jgi:hypothetical protein
MRNSHVVKAVLPLLAGAAVIGGTTAPAASARTPHLCGASATFAQKLIAFEKSYDKGASKLGQPNGKTVRALASYLDNAAKFFNSETHGLTTVGKYAPSSVSLDDYVARLKKTSADFRAAAKDIRSGDIPATEKHAKAAAKAANGFADALPTLIKKCS